ncbi:hypothetical protein [Streptomyces sp. NPDC021562]|uniref:hypothetical protein n=1 Tax=Streptomyces sp. NPDC021562 TaxID=3155121 RepID=UPI0033DE1182
MSELLRVTPPALSDLPSTLDREQVRLLEIISQPLLNEGKSATWGRVLDLAERGEGMNAETTEAVLHSLPRVGGSNQVGMSYGFTSVPERYMNETSEIRPTVAAGLVLPDLKMMVSNPFLSVLHHMVELHLNRPIDLVGSEPVRAVLRSGELAQAMSRMRPEFIAVLPELFRFEPYIQAEGSSTSPDGEWEWRIQRNIVGYEGADSLEAYVAKTCEMVGKSNRSTVYPPRSSLGPFTSPDFRNVSFDDQVAVEASTGNPQPAENPSVETRGVYVKEAIITELEDLDSAGGLRTDKLVGLLRELNFNYANSQPLASNSLLRAVMDHVPPGFGFPIGTTFATVVAQAKWGQSDKKYLKKLTDFRDQGDDVMHRQIDQRRSRIDMDDMPQAAAVNAMLDGLVVALQKSKATPASQ